MDESEVHRELELKELQPYYNRIVEQLASLDQKAQAMIGLEGLLLALMAVFSSSIPNNQPARAAVWASMVVLLASALCSLLVMRIRYGTTIIARSKTVEEGMLEYRSTMQKMLTRALMGADCAITMTEWNHIRKLEAKDFQAYMKTPNIVDARRIYNPEELSGLNYVSIGLGPSTGMR